MRQKIPITVAHGDGIGPEIMEASLHIIQESGAALEVETIEIGEKVYLRGNTAGIDPSSWESLRRTKVFYKAPITTPQSGGFKSLNVTARKRLGLYANIRPCVAYVPYVDTKHPGNGKSPQEFGEAPNQISHDGIQPRVVDNRGTIVWPGGMSETFVVDSFRCRFQPLASAPTQAVNHTQIAAIYQKVTAAGYDIVKTETLHTFDGQQGFTLAQGQ